MDEQPQQKFNISGDASLDNVQIGGIAGGDLNVTQIQGQVVNLTVYDQVNALQGLSQTSIRATQSFNRQDYRYRQLLLDKVKKFWIEGVLEKSLHMKVLIELGLEERGEFIPSAIEGVEEFSTDSRQSFAAGTDAAKIFQDIGAGRTLLILGEPGSGKTVTLLKLAESLVARTENDLSQPLPLVLNLSSWAKQRQTIAEWLVQEIKNIYGASKSLAKAWVEQEQLLLLLDGLDEVDGKYRNDCVKALNSFMENHGLTELVVCCRIRDYESLSERLQLRSAICVQPLTNAQIDQYLHQAGEQLSALQTLLKQNEEIRAFASSPLILSIMSLAYQGCSIDLLQKSLTSETFYQRLFDSYIERMLTRRGTTQKYSQENTRHWLIWIAKQIFQESQTKFLIENLQPSLLQTRAHRLFYWLLGTMLPMLIVTPIILHSFWIMNKWIGLVFGLLLVVIATVIDYISKFTRFGYFNWMYQYFRDDGKIRTGKSLKWSGERAKKGFTFGMVMGAVLTPVVLLFRWINEFWWGKGEPDIDMLVPILKYLPLVILIGALTCGTVGYLVVGWAGYSEIEKTTYPNQGIWNLVTNSTVALTVVFVLWSTAEAILVVMVQLPFPISAILYLGFFLGLGVSILFGGGSCYAHFCLRILLYRLGYIPWNYARFLDYAAERLFLQKVGGGYIFVHRMLLEHFAQMELE